MPLDQYCATHIDPFKVEIEQPGIQALMDVVIGPAGFRVEITYLDRSPSSQANTFQFEPNTSVYTAPPTLRLLFRPYDTLPI
jgi:ubiquitin thioesterase protein OTUB1